MSAVNRTQKGGQCALQGVKLRIHLLSASSRHLFVYFWSLWTREILSRVIFYLVDIALVMLLVAVAIGIVDYFRSTPNSLPAEAIRVLKRVTVPVLGLILTVVPLLWLSLHFIARQTLVVLILGGIWGSKQLDFTLRLLGTLPTLILGNAFLVLTESAGVRPQNPAVSVLFVLITLTLIGLPTVLQIGKEVIGDYDRRQVQQAVALGISRIEIGKKVVIPSFSRSLKAAVTVATGRIIIEGYIILDRTVSHSATTIAIRTPEDLLDIFFSIYSTMTIQSNALLILLLFAMGILINIWSFSIVPTPKQ